MGARPMPNGAVSRLASDSGSTPHITTAGRAWRGVPEHEGPARERRVDEHGVDRVDRVRAHHRARAARGPGA